MYLLADSKLLSFSNIVNLDRQASHMTLSADLKGKRALITGASSGFGAHFARVLAAAGAAVIVAARRTPQLKPLAAEISAAGGIAEVATLDVADAGSVGAVISAVGPFDILVNNAGVTNMKAVLDQTEADWDTIIDTNLKGSWLVATEAARSMRAYGRPGSIINIASILGLRQGGHVAPYAISKAGVVQLTKQLGLELARYQIRVNAIAPGYFSTELNRAFFDSEAGKVLIARVPQRRLGNLHDLDGPLLLLASDASSFMSGAVLSVDGGHLLSQL
jgi:NAD(P)-dependent dehydrogenase (short-subunit alcohol dehydrogenase family)